MSDQAVGTGASGLRAAGRRRLRRVHKRLGDDPRWLPIVLRATPLGTSRRIDDETELVVEGFPRSGNTFAVFAFRDAQVRAVKVTSHVHVPSQVRLAVRRGLPTVVTIRPPRPTIVSLVIAAPHLSLRTALEEYIHHHELMLEVHDGLELATFDQITGDLGAVIDRVNHRWATDFARYENDPVSDARVFAAIDAHHRALHGDTEHVVPRPSTSRREEATRLARALDRPELAEEVARAQATYEALVTV